MRIKELFGALIFVLVTSAFLYSPVRKSHSIGEMDPPATPQMGYPPCESFCNPPGTQPTAACKLDYFAEVAYTCDDWYKGTCPGAPEPPESWMSRFRNTASFAAPTNPYIINYPFCDSYCTNLPHPTGICAAQGIPGCLVTCAVYLDDAATCGCAYATLPSLTPWYGYKPAPESDPSSQEPLQGTITYEQLCNQAGDPNSPDYKATDSLTQMGTVNCGRQPIFGPGQKLVSANGQYTFMNMMDGSLMLFKGVVPNANDHTSINPINPFSNQPYYTFPNGGFATSGTQCTTPNCTSPGNLVLAAGANGINGCSLIYYQNNISVSTEPGVGWVVTGSPGAQNCSLVMQDDGNLVLYGENCRGPNGSCWASNTLNGISSNFMPVLCNNFPFWQCNAF